MQKKVSWIDAVKGVVLFFLSGALVIAVMYCLFWEAVDLESDNIDTNQTSDILTLQNVVEELRIYYAKYGTPCHVRGCNIVEVTEDGEWVHVKFQLSYDALISATKLNGYYAGQILQLAKPAPLGWCDTNAHRKVIVHGLNPNNEEVLWMNACGLGSEVHHEKWSE